MAKSSPPRRLLPVLLAKGDTVGLVSPSSAFEDSFSLQLARGEVHPDNPAARQLPAALLGVMVFHELITGQPLTEKALRDYLDAVVIPALLTDPAKR